VRHLLDYCCGLDFDILFIHHIHEPGLLIVAAKPGWEGSSIPVEGFFFILNDLVATW
jgi:hypothetical protein